MGVAGLNAGHLAVQYARIAGAEVVAVDVSEERLKTASDLGADHLVHAGEQDVAAEIQKRGGRDHPCVARSSGRTRISSRCPRQ